MEISEAIYKFGAITLPEMDSVKLMNRTDQKYWFHCSLLAEILMAVSQDYYILEVEGERNLPYSTTYYDTPRDDMFRSHQCGKLNRYKIRRRRYDLTRSSFLEVKFKNNKGRTIKTRQSSAYDYDLFNGDDMHFVEHNSPYECCDLIPVLENHFCRLMLVSRTMGERCTIDTSLCFDSHGRVVHMDDMVVVEVKRDGRSHSDMVTELNRRRIKPSGFSKYCIGRCLTDDSLRQNRFKPQRRRIDKTIINPINNNDLWR